MKKISDFEISTPLFDVKLATNDRSTKVNEYTFRNLQLQTALKTIEPFWFVNLEGEWEQCRPDGCLRTHPYSLGFVPDKWSIYESALGLADSIAIKLFDTFKSRRG